jgi:hypothetical protein
MRKRDKEKATTAVTTQPTLSGNGEQELSSKPKKEKRKKRKTAGLIIPYETTSSSSSSHRVNISKMRNIFRQHQQQQLQQKSSYPQSRLNQFLK